MSVIGNKKVGGFDVHFERYESAIEVVENCKTREITNSSFNNMRTKPITKWNGVNSYEEALEYMRTGYQPTVDSMKGVFKGNLKGTGSRFTFKNDVKGFAPVVPLALKGVPNSMVAMTMKPIKTKVVDIYYDMTTGARTSSDQIMDAGRMLLSTVIELERQGYRFNLYIIQGYSGADDCDMLVVKVKNAAQHLDLKRVSFPLTHTAFFRVIGFDWYSKFPGAKYRPGYGQALTYRVGKSKAKRMMKDLFGNNAISFSAIDIIESGKDYIKAEVESKR